LKKIQQKAGKTMQENAQSRERSAARPRRQANRRANALFLKIAGGRFRAYSALKHIGRSSGREYVSPLTAYPLGDGFVMAVLYGEAAKVDWCRNVMAAGRCVLKTGGQEYVLEKPEIIPASKALAAYPLLMRIVYRSRRIQEFMWAHRKQG
jgi:hypothetical protein